MAGRGVDAGTGASEPVIGAPAAQRGSRGRPRDPAADAAILRAAVELFVEHGLDGTSIEQVARLAGVARLTVYRRWANKEELLAQALDSARADVHEWSPEELSDIDVVELGTAIARAVGRPEYQRMLRQLVGSSAKHPELMEVYVRRYIMPRRTALTTMLRAMVRRGELPADTDPAVLMDLLAGGLFYQLIVRPDACGPADLLDFLHRALRQAGWTGAGQKASRG